MTLPTFTGDSKSSSKNENTNPARKSQKFQGILFCFVLFYDSTIKCKTSFAAMERWGMSMIPYDREEMQVFYTHSQGDRL